MSTANFLFSGHLGNTRGNSASAFLFVFSDREVQFGDRSEDFLKHAVVWGAFAVQSAHGNVRIHFAEFWWRNFLLFFVRSDFNVVHILLHLLLDILSLLVLLFVQLNRSRHVDEFASTLLRYIHWTFHLALQRC
jgi:hypothetical protein